MNCHKFDTRTFEAALDDGNVSIIHVEKGDVDKAIEVIYRQMDIIENTYKYKLSLKDKYYYYTTYPADIFQEALANENIIATIWD